MDGVAADLVQVWEAGKRHVPAIAEMTIEARDQLMYAPSASEAFLDESYHETHSLWTVVMENVATTLGLSAGRIDQIGQALTSAAEDYANTDGELADDFYRLLADRD